MASIALFQPDDSARARLRDALCDRHDVEVAESWEALRKLVSGGSTAGVVVDPYTPFAPVSLFDLEHFRSSFPRIAIVVYADFEGRELDLFHLGRFGVDEVLLADGRESLRTVEKAVVRALDGALARWVVRELRGAVSPTGVRAAEWAIRQAADSPRVQDLARALRVSPRSLRRTLHEEGLPSARHLLLWGRLFQAGRMLECGEGTVEDVAFRLGYATAASLGRALKERTGLAPTELGERGGVDEVLVAFLRACREALRGEEKERGKGYEGSGDSLIRRRSGPGGPHGTLPPGSTGPTRSRRWRSRPVGAGSEGGEVPSTPPGIRGGDVPT